MLPCGGWKMYSAQWVIVTRNGDMVLGKSHNGQHRVTEEYGRATTKEQQKSLKEHMKQFILLIVSFFELLYSQYTPYNIINFRMT